MKRNSIKRILAHVFNIKLKCKYCGEEIFWDDTKKDISFADWRHKETNKWSCNEGRMEMADI